ncbi:hypothetical protein ASD51_20645 [Streptomyces sp. Root55]|nr:hypothetical protein ASD26_25565 [Streptomyces sp. Root1319]KQZ03500.1 hypothetical protein ASD51_20645 [Streptomyces sp. Root55]
MRPHLAGAPPHAGPPSAGTRPPGSPPGAAPYSSPPAPRAATGRVRDDGKNVFEDDELDKVITRMLKIKEIRR